MAIPRGISPPPHKKRKIKVQTHTHFQYTECSLIKRCFRYRLNILQFSRGGKEINNGMAHLELDYKVLFFKKIIF